MMPSDPFPDGIPGVIDGSMTIRANQGTLTFRVVCRLGGRRDAGASLVELIVDANHIEKLSRALAADFAGDSISDLPCRIGLSLDVSNAAA
jgi:hypothetical protein